MDLERIAALLELLGEHEVGEFQYKDDAFSLKVRIGAHAHPHVVATHAAPQMAQLPPPGAASGADVSATESSAPAGATIDSPMVGTFYRSPSPDAEPFVQVGDRVTPGKVLCIVEAMKLMNEIECDVTGTIAEILVDDAQPVQFGQALFTIRPD